MLLTGSEIVVECLKEQGVDTVFGYPGGTILNVYDALYQHSDEITHILTSHEQGASHAADGYARATGKVGVCMATSGPGATNLVTGIATAMMDSSPVVAITCNVAVPMLGKDSFQEIDITGITLPITKHNFIVKDINKLADTIREAFTIARSGRPGPVLVDITKDVTAAKCEFTPLTPVPAVRANGMVNDAVIDMAVNMINESKKPVIMVGGGAISSEASEELQKFAVLSDAPVMDTLMGKGAFDGTSPRYLGMVGMHGTKAANYAVTEADLLIALGCRFSDRVIGNATKFAPNAKILHIDIDEAEINKNVKTDGHIVGDLKFVLSKINAKLPQQDCAAWLERITELKEQYTMTYYAQDRLTAPFVMETIDKVLGGEGIITTDVGQHQMWAAQYIAYRSPRSFLSSGGAGTMGFGLGAAIGAKMAHKDKTVINITGDGCFRMNMNEICTATRYNIPVIDIVVNNHVLGMVRQWQTLFYGQRYSNTILDDGVDFCKIAEGMGAKTYKITKAEEFEPALREAIALNIPVVIDCQIEKDDKVFPMCPPGAAPQECFSQEDLDAKKD